MNRDAALQIRKREVHATIAAIRRPEQAEEGLILIDRKELPVAERPALGLEVPGDEHDLAEIGSDRLRCRRCGARAPRQRGARRDQAEPGQEPATLRRGHDRARHGQLWLGKTPDSEMMKLMPR